MDSGAPESAQGSVTYSGGLSTMGTDAGRSARGVNTSSQAYY